MSPRRVLYVAADGRLSIWQQQHGRVTKQATFDATDTGENELRQFMMGNRAHCHLMLVNSATEEVVGSSIPKIRGNDRKALINRKLEQHFPGTRLRQLIAHSPSEPAGKTERLTLAAIKEPELEQRWLPLVSHCHVLLEGIYTTSQLAAPLLKHLKLAQRNALLLVVQDEGLRAVQLVNHQPTYTRFTSWHTASDEEIPGRLSVETSRLCDYLHDAPDSGQEGTARIIIAPRAVLAGLPPPFRETARPSPTLLALEDVFQTEPHDKHTLASASEALFIQELLHETPRFQLGPQEIRLPLRQRKRELLSWRVSTATLCLSLIYAVPLWHTNAQLKTQSQQLAFEAEKVAQMRSTPTAPAADSPDDASLQRLLGELASQRMRGGHPGTMLHALADWLNENPAYQLKHLEWEIAPLTGSTASSREITRIRLEGDSLPHESIAESLKKSLNVRLHQPTKVLARQYSSDALSRPDSEFAIERDVQP